jgi:hypothetical protein
MLKRRARAGERGQTLILALSFIAFFALVAASVLTLASSVESQRGSTERTASIDSVAEGSGQFAMSDSGYQGCGPSSPGGSGTMSFPSTIRADTVTYNIPAGSAGCGVSTYGNAAAANCELCILNSAPDGSTPAYGLTTPALTIGAGKNISVGGEVDSNGNISGTVTSTGASPKIGLWKKATCSACTPAATKLATPFLDPVAGTYLDPSNGGPAQSLSSSGGLIHPGVYSSISVNPGKVWMATGVYIDTGILGISGTGGVLTNTDASTPNSTDGDSGGPVDSGSGGLITSNPSDSGSVSTATANTLTDTSKAWTANQWVGATVSVTEKNKTVVGTVTGNTGTKLTVTPNWIPPSIGNAYVVYPSTVSYTATTLKDTSKNWTTNWAGYVVTVIPSGGSQETAIVSSNTTTTLTMTAPWATTPSPVNGYVVSRIGYTPTKLVDTTKVGVNAWSTNQWAGDVVVVTLAGGAQDVAFVSSNTTNTLTVPGWGATTPAGGNAYSVSQIGYTSTTLVDATKNWTTNWAGALVTVTLSNSTETDTVASNTANTLTMTSPWAVTPSPGNGYTLLLTTVTYPTSTTLKDTSKNWITNPSQQWVGAIVTVTLSNGSTETDTVLSNTATTLTMKTAWMPVTPSTGNQYTLIAPVVIYLACPTSPPYWSCAPAGQSGGYAATSGSGTFAIAAYPSGPYAGTVLFTDPNLIDPPGGNAVSVAGNGGVSIFGGTVYAPRGSMSVSGGGSTGTGVSISGRLIVRALSVPAKGNDNSQLIFNGGGPSSSISTCFYYTASLAGTEANSMITAHVRFETGCISAGLSGSGLSSRTSIISFAYG